MKYTLIFFLLLVGACKGAPQDSTVKVRRDSLSYTKNCIALDSFYKGRQVFVSPGEKKFIIRCSKSGIWRRQYLNTKTNTK